MKIPHILPPQVGPLIPKEWRADVALIASIFGAIAFTTFSGILVYIMWKGGWPIETAAIRIEVLSKALMLSLSGSLVVLITLGFAINRRSVKISKDGLEATGGEDDPDPTTTTTSVTTAVNITTPSPQSSPAPAPAAEPEAEPKVDADPKADDAEKDEESSDTDTKDGEDGEDADDPKDK